MASVDDVFKYLAGAFGFDTFQIGKGGPKIKNNAGKFELKNADDTSLVTLKVAAPTEDDEVVNKKYFETVKGNVVIGAQADTSAALPTNTAVRRYLVVTISGTGAVLGDLLFDDGSSSGDMEIIAKFDGRSIVVTTSLVGGTIEFLPNSMYTWDEATLGWILSSDVGFAPGAVRKMDFAIINLTTQDSSDLIPGDAIIDQVRIRVKTVYDASVDMQLGRVLGDGLDLDLIFDSSTLKFLDLQSVGTYVLDRNVGWGSIASEVRSTLIGAGAPGSGGTADIIITFSVPIS